MELENLTWRQTNFGDMLVYDTPEYCTMVILCIDLHQHVPVRILLPHQIYKKDLLKLLDEHPSARGITIIPVNHEDKIEIDPKELRRGQ